MPIMKKILIVDDQPINRQILEKLLSTEYQVLSACNGEEALEILNREHGDISAILLDIVMPVLDGYSVLAELSKNDILRNIPVIVATQKFGDESEEKALSLGASDFVTKPYKPEIIRHRLRNLINMHEATATVDIVEKDILTNLLNKEAFYHKASEVILQNPNTNYDIVALDIERFKLINDTYGTIEGDKLLKYIASKISDISLTNNCICSRTNADKFIILIQRVKGKTPKIIEKAIKNIENYPLSMKIHIKFGIYEIDDRSISVTSMCDRAILAANAAKGHYGKSYTYYDDSIIKKLVFEQRITDEMNNALAENQFKVYFQPKYDLTTEHISGAEALVRWIHPEYGFMSPGDFIPIFERNGFITELDIFVWEKTCEIISSWKKVLTKMLPVSVNVSRKDIYKEDLPEILIGLVNKYELDPADLHLEITETAYTEDSQQLIDVVGKLKKLGFIIEMDDFGNGYSSLNMLSELPIDILKLDMKFMQTNYKQYRTKNIMSFVIGLARWMNLLVVAEGVETQEQVDSLKKLNCNYVQGFFFSPPIAAEDFTEMLMNSEITVMINPNDTNEPLNQIIVGDNICDKTMLIVDDLFLNRTILAEYFKDTFNIVEAPNGAVALNYIKEHHSEIDIIMLDLIMPVMDGYNFLEKLGSDNDCKHIPVIVTSQAGEISEAKALSMGAADFIAKPYSKDVAIQRVNKVLSKPKIIKSISNSFNSTNYSEKYDLLTGLYTNTQLEAYATDYLTEFKDAKATIIIIDIDNFKFINKSLSRDNGDCIICHMSDILRTHFGKDALISRHKDIFIVFIKHNIPSDELRTSLNDLCRTLSYKIDGILITCSIGACTCPEHGNDFRILYNNADIAMLTSKSYGKNQVQIFDKDLIQPSRTLFRNMGRLLDESVDSIVVCDSETYNLLYINETACKMYNKDKKDCLGNTCYSTLWNRETPCDYCVSINVQSDAYSIHQYESDDSTSFTIKSKLIDWGERSARIHYIHHNE